MLTNIMRGSHGHFVNKVSNVVRACLVLPFSEKKNVPLALCRRIRPGCTLNTCEKHTKQKPYFILPSSTALYPTLRCPEAKKLILINNKVVIPNFMNNILLPLVKFEHVLRVRLKRNIFFCIYWRLPKRFCEIRVSLKFPIAFS